MQTTSQTASTVFKVTWRLCQNEGRRKQCFNFCFFCISVLWFGRDGILRLFFRNNYCGIIEYFLHKKKPETAVGIGME